jgi:hypothetical protein
MTPEQFCYWLQGASETIEDVPSERQWKVISDHLAIVFNKVTPDHKADSKKTADNSFTKELERIMREKTTCEVAQPYRTGASGGTSGVRIC